MTSITNTSLVSIIMPCYNNAAYVEQSIQSVQEQTYDKWELLIVDDGSTDNSVAIIQDLASKDNRIHLIVLPENSGAAIARNTALREARGKYVAFLDSDDTWHPEKLARQIAFMEENNYIYSYTAFHREDTHMLVSGPKRVTKCLTELFCWMNCCTVMYNREEIGLVQITPLRKNNDYAMWLHICEKADCYLLDEDLVAYNHHKGSISSVSVIEKLKWHYRLWRQEMNYSPLAACFLSLVNGAASVYKKVLYYKHLNTMK